MVKSKKMSKTGIAVIVLAILLVLSLVMGMTGAWFTASNKATESASSIKFGSIGDVAITLSGVTHYDSAGNILDSGEGAGHAAARDVMPGDRVEAGGITLTYTATGTDDTQVYYVVYDGTNYYTLSGEGNALVVATTQPGTITSGTPISFAGSVLSVSSDGTNYYALDGAVLGASGTSSAITNDGFEGEALSDLNPKVGGFAYAVGTQKYAVAVIQMENAGTNGANVWSALQVAAQNAYNAA